MNIESWITVVETEQYLKTASKIFTNKQLDALVEFIANSPLVGDLIIDTGGLRKLRWEAKGKGKRGGARVIYYFYDYSSPIFLLTAYGKGEQENLNKDQEKILRKYTSALKNELKKWRQL